MSRPSIGIVRMMVPALATMLAACAGPSTGPSPASRPTVQLVDSVAWENEMDSGALHRVEVRTGTRVDTIPGVLTAELPLVLGGSRVLGFGYREGDVVDAFEYDARRRRVAHRELPGDLNAFSTPVFSPDGLHVAYLVAPGDGTGFAIARTWPGKAEVWRGNPIAIPATDACCVSRVRWLSPDEAEVYIESDPGDEPVWLRVRGSIRQKSVVATDTMPAPPEN